MADVYLWDETASASDVVLHTSAAAASGATVSTGGSNPLPRHQPSRRRPRDDEDVLLAAVLI